MRILLDARSEIWKESLQVSLFLTISLQEHKTDHKNQQSTVMILARHTQFCPCINESHYMLLLASNRQTGMYWMGLWMEFA